MKNFKILIYLIIIFFPSTSNALIEVDITRGNLNPLPVAVSPLFSDKESVNNIKKELDIENLGLEISNVVKDNLKTTKLLVSQLQDIKSANKVKKTLSKRYENRKGGYTRIIKAGFRYGDNAPMAIIEFVDRDVEAKRVDKPKKDITKETPKTEEKKQDTT